LSSVALRCGPICTDTIDRALQDAITDRRYVPLTIPSSLGQTLRRHVDLSADLRARFA